MFFRLVNGFLFVFLKHQWEQTKSKEHIVRSAFYNGYFENTNGCNEIDIKVIRANKLHGCSSQFPRRNERQTHMLKHACRSDTGDRVWQSWLGK